MEKAKKSMKQAVKRYYGRWLDEGINIESLEVLTKKPKDLVQIGHTINYTDASFKQTFKEFEDEQDFYPPRMSYWAPNKDDKGVTIQFTRERIAEYDEDEDGFYIKPSQYLRLNVIVPNKDILEFMLFFRKYFY